MNLRQRRQLAKEEEEKRKGLERIYMRRMRDSLRTFYSSFASILKDRGVQAARAALDKTTLDASTGELIKAMYKRIGLSYAKYTRNQIRREARFGGVKERKPEGVLIVKLTPGGAPGSQINFNERWTQMIEEYFRMYLINKAVVPITIESKARIAAILGVGIKEGWTIERMAKELETDRLVMYRARLIVRTETAKAAYYGRRLGAQDSGFETTKEWISARDSRTRHSHRDMDGVIIGNDAVYNVPVYKGDIRVGTEEMRGPGDPQASAGNVCNCRCTEGYAAKRDANGRLIRKPISRVTVIQPGNFNRPIPTVTI